MSNARNAINTIPSISKSQYRVCPHVVQPIAKWRFNTIMSGLEVIKLEFILKLKVKRNDWLLAQNKAQ